MQFTDNGMAALSGTDGQASQAAPSRPIDLAHLARQTMGDKALEAEVLALFVDEALAARNAIRNVQGEERARLAHGLKGAARGIGAFAVADCAEAIERNPCDRCLPGRLADAIDAARDFIAGISR